MTTFKAVVRRKRADGFYPVYIRVVHRTKMGYISTGKIIAEKQIKSGEIKDAVVNEYCSKLILHYSQVLNKTDFSNNTVSELIEYLTHSYDDLSFSDYAREFFDNMERTGQLRNAKNYRLAVGHLERYLGTNKIMFSMLSSSVLKKWIETLMQTNRAKEMYPTCIRQIFKKALLDLNDEERGICRIKFNPWLKISIPKSDRTTQRAISAEACRDFFNRPLPQSKMVSPLPELGRDVALMSLCLGGINTVDLYEMKSDAYNNGIISYKRAKTRHSRKDEAYMEMRVEPFIESTFNKYLSNGADEYLFNFHQRYRNPDSFNANVNIGIRAICKDMGMKKEDYYCFYTFRHTWATIAQNDCDANLYDVAFGLNHSRGLNVTRGYVKIDYTPAWELNAKVIDFIFYSDKPSKQGKAKDLDEPKDKMFRISKRMMIYGRAYFKGKIVGEVTDIGFNTVEDVINVLVKQLPSDIPIGCTVQFRLTNCDSQREVVYERSKGKGF
ncbi:MULTISPECIES: phage integrase SAM-like domain-containing protein [Bacteroidales]|uniref:tyrosine-type recombinase/integrase n=1 Tax=Prevotella heparinolytica TaxID=28113 RepID=UPI002A800F55|nr:phage integrase SAM-like domain-containing protein [Prevotella sp.]MDY4020125.1 phage integrase SAM-like domain-containing protein [Prevotella sp.]